jgi:hypothetical protein
MALAFTLFFLICAMWIGLAALYFVALRREGSDLEPAARLWAWLKIAEYGLLLVLLVSAVRGAPRWAVLVMGSALARTRVREKPGQAANRCVAKLTPA